MITLVHSHTLFICALICVTISDSNFTADIECPIGQKCTIDCPSNKCLDSSISGHSATDLLVNCDYWRGCQYAHIYCPQSINSSCTIQCGQSESCQNITIYGDATNAINIESSSTHSFRYATVYANNSDKINVNCSNLQSCGYAEIYASEANNVNLRCAGYVSHYTQSPCYNLKLHSKFVKTNIKVNCMDRYSCYSPYIYADNAKNVYINAIGQSLYGGYIYAQSSSNLSINLQSNKGDKSGAEQTRFYIPPDSRTNLNCIGYGCHQIDLYALNGMEDIENITFHGCDLCLSLEECIRDWGLYCGPSYNTTTAFTGETCAKNKCSCSDLKSTVEDSWTLNIDETCHVITADIECKPGEKCIIDCSSNSCKSKTIWGHLATELVVKCEPLNKYYWGYCESTNIYCPETVNSSCNILCGGSAQQSCLRAVIYGYATNRISIQSLSSDSFKYGTVYADDSDQVNLICSHQASCANAVIHASEANTVNVTCMGYVAEFSNYSPCYQMQLNASFLKKEVIINCKDRYSCALSEFYVDNAKSVKILGDNAYYALWLGKFYAKKASNFQLTCIGDASDHGCYNGEFYVPDKENTTINCFGYGCSYFELHVQGGMTSLASSDITINSCAACASLYDCVQQWEIDCVAAPASMDWTYFSNGSCRWDACNCSSHTDLFLNKYTTDLNQDGCQDIKGTTFNPTPVPVSISTTLDPTIYPTTNPSNVPMYIPTTSSYDPTKNPTIPPPSAPTKEPSKEPTKGPTRFPTFGPSSSPTHGPILIINTLSRNTTAAVQTSGESGNSDAIGIDQRTLFIIVTSILICLCIIGNIVLCIKCRGRGEILHGKLSEEKDEDAIADIEVKEYELQLVQRNICLQMHINTDDRKISGNKEKYMQLKEDKRDGNTTGVGSDVSAIN